MSIKPRKPHDVMIMVAPNGARRTKADHPALPMTAGEIADEARACKDAGASAIHMHVRGDDGAHLLDAARYHVASEAVRAVAGTGLVVQITTEAVGIYQADEQMQVVRDVVPEAVSMAVREIVPDAASEAMAKAFLLWCQSAGAAPQFILYDAADVHRLLDLRSRGVVPFMAPFLLFVLGRYATDQQSSPEDLEPFLEALGECPFPWAMCAFGARELDCARTAVAAGGHIRIGFENNMYLADGSLAPTNADLIAQAAEAVRQLGCGVMNGEQARALMALSLQ